MEDKLIFKAMQGVMGKLGAVGKDGTNQAQKWRYRTIDSVYNALHPILAEFGVFCTPTVLDMKVMPVDKGSRLILTVKYTFYATDGSFFESVVMGEGADFGDKSVSKAMTYAFKYLLMQTFCIALETEKDPDGEIVEQKPTKKSSKDDAVLAELRKAMIKSGIDSSFETMLLPKAKEIRAESFDEFMNQLCLIYDAMVG
jgi:hypothetical protein